MKMEMELENEVSISTVEELNKIKARKWQQHGHQKLVASDLQRSEVKESLRTTKKFWAALSFMGIQLTKIFSLKTTTKWSS